MLKQSSLHIIRSTNVKPVELKRIKDVNRINHKCAKIKETTPCWNGLLELAPPPAPIAIGVEPGLIDILILG